MSETKWTPGPWGAIDHGVGELCVYCVRDLSDEENAICVFDDEDDFWSWEDGYSTSGEAKANACLIAAAPELYEALELMRATFADGEAVTDHDFAVALSTAEDALAKARGETTGQGD